METDTNELDDHCISSDFPWSIIDSSTPNAHLAAVLAGFMVTAIIFLLRRETTPSNNVPEAVDIAAGYVAQDSDPASARIHTIAMFLTGVVILAFDSYLFGSTASMHPVGETLSHTVTLPNQTLPQTITVAHAAARPDARYVCSVVWTQGIPASGMLAVGGALLVAGLGWTTTQFAKDINHQSRFFACLGNLVTWATMIICIAAFMDTALMYIEGMQKPPFNLTMERATGAVWIACGATTVVVTLFIGWRTAELWWRRHRQLPWGNEADLGRRYATLTLACFLAVVLAAGGPVWVLIMDEPRTTDMGSVWWATVGGVFLPCLIYICIAYTVPGPPTAFWKTAGKLVKGIPDEVRVAIRSITPSG